MFDMPVPGFSYNLKSGKNYYCFYNTVLQCSSGITLPAEMRIYSPINDVAVEDDTVVFAHCRAYLLYNEILLDASHIFPFPGDPSSREYDENLPNCHAPYVTGVGHVPFHHEVLSENGSKAFNVICSEYVRDGTKTSTIQCVYDGSTPRWNNTPTPNVNSTIHFVGILSDMSQTGTLRVNLENIALNIGHHDANSTVSTPTTTPVKKRKFASFASLPILKTSVSPLMSGEAGPSSNVVESPTRSPSATNQVNITNISKSSTTPLSHHNMDMSISERQNSPLSPIEDQSMQIESSLIIAPVSMLSDIPSDNAEHSETTNETNLGVTPSVKSLGKRKTKK